MIKRRPLFSPSPILNLRSLTQARIGLGHSGESLPTAALLAFQRDHARARDAVGAELDFETLEEQLTRLKLEPVVLQSQAATREEYLRHPPRGRRLGLSSKNIWQKIKFSSGGKILVVLGDGLSAGAIQRHGPPLLGALREHLAGQMFRQIACVRYARVAIADELASVAKARAVLHLIGERPGLTSVDNVSIYLTYRPQIGATDEARNCISNIGARGGLSIAEAAAKATYLVLRALQEERSGLLLKDDFASSTSTRILPQPKIKR